MIIYRLLITLPHITVLYADEFGNYYDVIPENSEIQDSPSLSQAMDDIRSQRNALLAACDWTQLPDSPLTDQQRLAWRTYRQQLRDYPSLINNELWTAPDWPNAPW